MKSALKFLVILCIFTGSLLSVIEIKGQVLSGRKLHSVVFYESNDSWQRCQLEKARIVNESNSVIFFSGAEQAELSTDIISAGFPFEQLILSWNATRPDSITMLQFDVEVSEDTIQWFRFAYQTWSPHIEFGRDELGQSEHIGIGKMITDYLVLQKPMRYARIYVRALGNSGSQNILLRRLAVSFANSNSNWSDYKINHPQNFDKEFGKVHLSVPYFTQRSLPQEMAGDCCSPTSVSMVLNYHGKQCTAEDFARQAYDGRGNLYGNWPQNVAAAYNFGLGKTWVDSHCCFDEIYDEVASGKPVVISIAYKYDELPHSPIHEAPDGHLIAVVGFDGPNTVICNDPAGHNVEDGIVSYPRHELEKIWIAHGGVAYHLWPE